MIVRAPLVDELEVIKEIHLKHYAHEFPLPSLDINFLCLFVVEDEGQIISAGGVRTLAESVIVTDKDQSVRKRKEALLQVLSASRYLCEKFGYSQLHAFINDDEIWENHLRKYGFQDCKGKAVFLQV